MVCVSVTRMTFGFGSLAPDITLYCDHCHQLFVTATPDQASTPATTEEETISSTTSKTLLTSREMPRKATTTMMRNTTTE